MLHIGGWFDPYLRGTLHLYQAMAGRSQFPQHLIIGPWGHLPWGRKVGAVDYGEEAVSPVDIIQVKWFDYFLKGQATDIDQEPPVRLFEMGSDRWRYFEEFPRQTPQVYYLHSGGLASIREDDGRLTETIPLATVSSPTEDILVHDPWRPVPAWGGQGAIPAGSFDRSPLDCRSDILTYTSLPLLEDWHLAGEIGLEIYCLADVPSFDLCGVLSVVYPDGKVYNFSQGYKRIDREESQELPLKFPLQATCIRIEKGNRLRLSLSAACFPAYPVNPGTGKLPTEAKAIEAKIITLKIKSGSQQPSQVIVNKIG
jgi:putative CocE/NonD family hydrolase